MSNAKATKRKYEPPISWDRLNKMILALAGRIYKDKPIDAAMARELSEAVYAIRNVYQKELDQSLPSKRANPEHLRVAALAELLIDWFHVSIPMAMEAASGKPHHQDDNSAVNRTFRNRLRILRNSGDRYFPSADEIEAARERLRKLVSEEK